MTTYTTIRPGVTVRVGKTGETSIRYQTMVAGVRLSKTCELDAAVAIRNWRIGMQAKNMRPTAILEADFIEWRKDAMLKYGEDDNDLRRVPTVAEFGSAFERVVAERWRRIGQRKPGEASLRAALLGYGKVVRFAGIGENESIRKLMDRRTLRRVLDRMQAAGLAGDTCKSYLASLQRMTAKWTQEYYDDEGIKIIRPEMPDMGGVERAKRYVRLPQELKDRIDRWYTGLQEERNRRLFAFATMVYQFAMRPNDVIRLTGENFVMKDGEMWLVYTPHKTAGTTGRLVKWKFAPDIQELMLRYNPKMCEPGRPFIPAGRWVHDELNYLMRRECKMDPEQWGKGVYELRKLCIDTVYHELGPKYAVALSGDRRDTVEYYYADPYSVTDDAPTIVVGRIRA